MAVVLYCRDCGERFSVQPDEALMACAKCQGRRLTSRPPLKFDRNDQRFLRSLRIRIDDDDRTGSN